MAALSNTIGWFSAGDSGATITSRPNTSPRAATAVTSQFSGPQTAVRASVRAARERPSQSASKSSTGVPAASYDNTW
ncbi:hypothetical protein GCM10009765_08970 [Fodinicola feengrottensis]|uniref:Uncharacterized protein n=1 Tax=Fodinicola feengrottensis TaxID=435914 RepID=A0ABN2FYR0_9ACTN